MKDEGGRWKDEGGKDEGGKVEVGSQGDFRSLAVLAMLVKMAVS